MKDDSLKELDRVNTNFANDVDRAYGKWCCGVLSTIYTDMVEGDKVHLVINQSIKNRPELVKYTNTETQCVLLNITVGAVIRFGMDFQGVTFECGLQGTSLFDTYTWDEVMAFEVRHGGWVKYQIPLDPDTATQMTKVLLDTRGVAGEVMAVIDTSVAPNNVVRPEFGKQKA